ncbi:hypothetical protein CR513_18227, partial [Mucuna pruriens]
MKLACGLDLATRDRVSIQRWSRFGEELIWPGRLHLVGMTLVPARMTSSRTPISTCKMNYILSPMRQHKQVSSINRRPTILYLVDYAPLRIAQLRTTREINFSSSNKLKA